MLLLAVVVVFVNNIILFLVVCCCCKFILALICLTQSVVLLAVFDFDFFHIFFFVDYDLLLSYEYLARLMFILNVKLNVDSCLDIYVRFYVAIQLS